MRADKDNYQGTINWKATIASTELEDIKVLYLSQSRETFLKNWAFSKGSRKVLLYYNLGYATNALPKL